eukprot:4579080-Ditylum_brightwellii.AAC.1
MDSNVSANLKDLVQSISAYQLGKYTKEYGAGSASILCLAEKPGITGANHIVIADSWFGGVRLPPGLKKIGLHNISMTKTEIDD